MAPLPAPLLGLLWYYTVSAVVFIMQTWTVRISNIQLFHIHTAIPIFFLFILLLLVWYMDMVCWEVWCTISGIIKLTIDDFCFQTNICVKWWAAVSNVHISYVLCPYGSVLTVFLCMKSLVSINVLPHIPGYIYLNTDIHTLCSKAHAQSQTITVNMFTYCTHTYHFPFSSSCEFFLHTF